MLKNLRQKILSKLVIQYVMKPQTMSSWSPWSPASVRGVSTVIVHYTFRSDIVFHNSGDFCHHIKSMEEVRNVGPFPNESDEPMV
jgi:hypothetical protein